MDEDELRAECYLLLRTIFVLQAKMEYCVGYGYEQGYTAGALSHQEAVESGDAACALLH